MPLRRRSAIKPAILSSKILDFITPSGRGGRSCIRARVIVVFAMSVPFVARVMGPAAPSRGRRRAVTG
jgi:hypothetical protein